MVKRAFEETAENEKESKIKKIENNNYSKDKLEKFKRFIEEKYKKYFKES